MLWEIWFFVSEGPSTFPTGSNVPSAFQIPLPSPVSMGPTSLFSKSPVHWWGDVAGKSCGEKE